MKHYLAPTNLLLNQLSNSSPPAGLGALLPASLQTGKGRGERSPFLALGVFLLRIVLSAMMLLWIAASHAAVTFTDNFTTNVNYLTNGIPGTIWDGIYLGAGEFANATGIGAAAGTVSAADANISSNGALTISSLQTDWENSADDGVLFFKVITGDFDMSVHVLGPINTNAYNFPGLMVRAFGAGGGPLQPSNNSISENSILWACFEEFGNANMTKINVNGGKTDTGRGIYPNSNFWLRVTRSANLFTFFERATNNVPWTNVATITRSDLSGAQLQVGIEHAVFGGGATRTARYSTFSLIASNLGPFSATPSAATALSVATNGAGGLNVSWTPGAGSAGSLVAVWIGTNSPIVKEGPASGFTYTANANYGLGGTLPGAGWSVVYVGSGSSVTVNNLIPGNTYNVAVFAYAGSGGTIAYNHSPPTGQVTIPYNILRAQATIQGSDVSVQFAANPGKWYWLQYSDTLNPPYWQNVLPGPILFTNVQMTLLHLGGGTGAQRYYRLQALDPIFAVKTSSGAVTSLQRTGDVYPTEYISGGKRVGDAIIKYQYLGNTTWYTVQTATLSGVASSSYTTSPDGTQYIAHYVITNGLPLAASLIFESVFTFSQDNTLYWTLNITNLTGTTVIIGDLALPLPMNQAYSTITGSAMKHSFISGYGSFLFWMRPNSVGPYLLLTPSENTKLEFWDDMPGVSGPPLGYEAFIHSYVAGTNAAAKNPSVTTGGSRWRQPNTTLSLGAGSAQTYGFKFQWANDYDGIRQALVNEGKIDVHIVPGMTVPTNLFAEIALRTTQTVASVTAEFPVTTQITSLGSTNVGTNTYQLYRVLFSQLGENELTITFGNSRTMYLEFFVTEPIDTLIAKRAAFLVNYQIVNPSLWYNSLYCDINVNSGVQVTPDNHDTLLNSFQVYEIASDDAGESRPAFMAEKEAVYPLQSEVSSLDAYITNFVWGGLQRATNETLSYAIYGVPDWHNLRTNASTVTAPGSFGRGYDYPHIIDMYYAMYKTAKFHPDITTALTPTTYLLRAYGTAIAMWTRGGGQATTIGLMNEVVIPDLINDLQAEGYTTQAATLRTNWETKVNYYVNGNANLFASEYSFDATGFESQEAYAKYAFQHAGSSPLMGSTNLSQFLQLARTFSTNQIGANVFDRGWLETAYYYYGSDYRGDMGDDFVVTYMAQMGGWGLLDYALYFATNNPDYLRLGYGSYLCGWSTMNTGTSDSNYGFWYPGITYDGHAGGGYEPSPYNSTWLGGQPMHRGPWYYSAEENLGFCGAMRSGATILADDPIFGRFCYGGTLSQTGQTNQIVPLDGVRRRFHAMLNASTLHMILDNDRFAANQTIQCTDNQSLTSFQIESEGTMAHNIPLHFTVSVSGLYTISNNHGLVTTTNLTAGTEAVLSLPIDANATGQPFAISR